jgi:hypothetical protein
MGLVYPYLLFAAAASLPIGGQAQVGPVPDHDVIVVTGHRVEDVKIDYRLARGRLLYCGRRDAEQDMSDVQAACRFVQECVTGGYRRRGELDACVDLKIAEQAWRAREEAREQARAAASRLLQPSTRSR